MQPTAAVPTACVPERSRGGGGGGGRRFCQGSIGGGEKERTNTRVHGRRRRRRSQRRDSKRNDACHRHGTTPTRRYCDSYAHLVASVLTMHFWTLLSSMVCNHSIFILFFFLDIIRSYVTYQVFFFFPQFRDTEILPKISRKLANLGSRIYTKKNPVFADF